MRRPSTFSELSHPPLTAVEKTTALEARCTTIAITSSGIPIRKYSLNRYPPAPLDHQMCLIAQRCGKPGRCGNRDNDGKGQEVDPQRLGGGVGDASVLTAKNVK